MNGFDRRSFLAWLSSGVVAAATLGAVLKYREDADRVRARLDILLAS